jgi:hypothetical protein
LRQLGGQGPDCFISGTAMHLAASVADCSAGQGENDRAFAVDFESWIPGFNITRYGKSLVNLICYRKLSSNFHGYVMADT